MVETPYLSCTDLMAGIGVTPLFYCRKEISFLKSLVGDFFGHTDPHPDLKYLPVTRRSSPRVRETVRC